MAAVDTIFEQLGAMSVRELVERKQRMEAEGGMTPGGACGRRDGHRNRPRPQSPAARRHRDDQEKSTGPGEPLPARRADGVSNADPHAEYLARAVAALTPEGHRRVDELLDGLAGS